MLALKAKQFDDGLYACVEMAADAGLGRLTAKKDFLLRLLEAVANGERTAASILTAAARLDGQRVQVSAEVANQADALQREFLADELRSKVLGFYTWNEQLARVFRRDRMLQTVYGDQPIPEGFDLGDEMVRRLRAGTLDLKPNAASGWYDHQTYALQALAVLEGMPEGKRLILNESYREELAGLFKALLARTRETHIKQLEQPFCGSAMGSGPPVKVKLYIAPNLTLEPLATYYLRRAHSYQFVRDVLERSFGPEGLEKMRRLTADGPVNLPLGEEIYLMQALFHGAYLQACGEIGMTPESESDLGNGKDANAHRAIYKAWLASIRKDPDLGKDVRMMVPIFYDLGRQKTKVWMVLGIATKPLRVSFVTPPMVKGIKGPDGRGVKSGDVKVSFAPDHHRAAYFATAEVYVTRLLDRAEFREHCARLKTYRAIVRNLQ